MTFPDLQTALLEYYTLVENADNDKITAIGLTLCHKHKEYLLAVYYMGCDPRLNIPADAAKILFDEELNNL